jgi:hypothetical protein
MPRRVERSGPPPGFDDDRRIGQRRDEPVAQQEAPLGRRRPGRDLGHDHPAIGDPAKQLLVTAGVEPIEPAGEHRDGRAAARQGGAVCRTVDAVRGSGHDREAAVDEAAGRLDRDVLAIAGRGSRTHEGDRTVERAQPRRIATHPEREGRVHVEVIQLLWPVVVTGNEHAHAEPPRLAQREQHRRRRCAWSPPLEGIRPLVGGQHICRRPVQFGDQVVRIRAGNHALQRLHRPDCLDQRSGVTVARLGDHGPGRTCEPFGDLLAIEVLARRSADERRELRLRDACDAHAAACRSSSARPI